MATTATQVVLDTPAAEFRLPATDGKTYALDDVAGEKGTVVVFVCNHCPYVKAVIDRMVADARVLMSEGVGFAAICSNDAASYPEDSFENMKRFAKRSEERRVGKECRARGAEDEEKKRERQIDGIIGDMVET